MEKEKLILDSLVRNSYMRAVWTHKIQEKEVDILTYKFKKCECIRIIFSSLTSVGLISIIFIDDYLIKLISALLSFVSTSISMFFKTFDLQTNITNHKNTALELLEIRDEFLYLIAEIEMNIINLEDLLVKFENLQKKFSNILKEAPNTSNKAVEKASIALKINKDNEFTNEEINLNMPNILKRSENL